MKFFIITVIVFAAMFGWDLAQATELADIMKGKVIATQGICDLNAKGEMAQKHHAVRQQLPCVLVLDPKDDEHAYFMIIVKGKANRLIKTNRDNTVQEVLWRNPESMV